MLAPSHIAAFRSAVRATSRIRNAALVLLNVALLLTAGAAAVRGQSALDGFDPNANSTVSVVVVQPDGKILLGGGFTTLAPNGAGVVTRNYIARLNPDGSLDTSFDPNPDNVVTGIAMQADGKILVSGIFTSIGGQTRRGLARLDPTTGLADSFDAQADEPVYKIAVQADRKILVSGVFTFIGGQFRQYMARLDPITGSADSFDPEPSSNILTIALQADGKILVGGSFTEIGGQVRQGIARLDSTTGLADSFDPNPSRGIPLDSIVNAIAVQADGKILAGGVFDVIGGQTRRNIARLDPTTGLADLFDPQASGPVQSIAVQADGRILVGGVFGTIGGKSRSQIARLDPATGEADSFNPSIQPVITGIAAIVLQADGKVLVGGEFSTVAPNGGPPITRNRIARLETDGRLDQTLNPSIPGGAVLATAVQPDGKIIIAGGFYTVLGVPRNGIARLNRDGTLDTAFDPNMGDGVTSIIVQADGKILVGGAFTTVGGETRNRIARLDATTGAADLFDPNANDQVYSLALQADGKILVAGAFTSVGGETRNRIARIDPTTGLADSFDPNANFIVQSIAVQVDGRILAGGGFVTIGGQARNYIARLDPATGLADSFNPNANGTLYSVALQADGKILAGGIFTRIGGYPRNRIARLDPITGLADSVFDPNADTQVQTIAVQADGKILAGGFFRGIGGQARNYIARLEATTGLTDSFDPNANFAVYSIVLQADGKVLVGGFFSNIGGRPRDGFARLSNDTAALQDMAVTQTTVTWTRGGSSPALARVSFESSSDNVNYTPLGNGSATGSNWTLTGLSLPLGQNIYIRARGYYRGGHLNASESITESIRNVFLIPTKALNLSTRMRVQTGDYVGIGGFIITGTAPKSILLRGIGPSLTPSGVSDALADPVLELYSGDSIIAYNNNWQDTDQEEIQATGIPPTNELEAALVSELSPGSYTVVLRGNNNGTGVALVEAYDLNPRVDSKLANLSTRALVNAGDDIVIAGFILAGGSDDRIVARGIGPSLTAAGVPNALDDPTLELRDGNGTLLRTNNDWQDDPVQAAELTAAGLAPANQLEAGIAMTLPPGLYTALLAGLNDGIGVGVVEIYDRGPP